MQSRVCASTRLLAVSRRFSQVYTSEQAGKRPALNCEGEINSKETFPFQWSAPGRKPDRLMLERLVGRPLQGAGLGQALSGEETSPGSPGEGPGLGLAAEDPGEVC